MKLNDQTRDIQRSGPFKEKTFTIAANAHAFEILSSRLYTDTMLAIVRELSTNAADAHTEAGNSDKPFDVHLPNMMEPYFSIRDYGTGLSPEAVDKVYTTYFESTRNNSNDFTGALGLGSKSPFSYTDMFTVVSYHNGTAYTYSAFKGEAGEPTVALMDERPTDQPNGLEIKIDTKPGHDWEFRDKARRIYTHFPVKPNIRGARVEYPTAKPVLSGEGWALYKGDSPSGEKVAVVMGKVCYAASRSKVTHNLGYSGQLMLDVPIGTCSIAANREELQYDDKTVATLQRLIQKAQGEARKQITEALGHCSCLLEKLIALKEFFDILDFPIQDKTIPTTKENTYKMRKLELRRGDKLFIGYDRWESELRPGGNTKYCFVEYDLNEDDGKIKQKYKNNLRHWLSQQGYANFYLITIEDRIETEKILGKPAIKLSEIPDAPRNYGGGNGNPDLRTFIKRLANGGRLAECWEKVMNSEDVDTTATGIAVPRKGYKVIWKGEEMEPAAVLRWANSLGYTNVYGLPSNRYEKMREDLSLDDFETEAKSKMEKFVKTADDYTRSQWHHSNKHEIDRSLVVAAKDLSPVCKNLYKLIQATPASHEYRQLLNTFGLELPEAEDYVKKFRQTYPLIASVNLRYTSLSDIIEYIELKEKK
jgi:hypothetical protein